MTIKSLSELKTRSIDVAALAKGLKSDSTSASKEAGIKLMNDAASYGLDIREYLLLAGKPETKDGVTLNGYERLLLELNLPVMNDFENGVHLQAASDTFSTYPGTRALFPQVIDDVLRFATRQDQFEKVAPMLANSRTISGAELLSTVVDDDSGANGTYSIAEGGRIPVRMIKTSEKSVKIYKHGSGIRTTYEFGRRASLELLIPHANRVARELELSKVAAATTILINGDGAYGAAGVINQSSYNTLVGSNSTNGVLSWAHLLAWLVARAQAGVAVDTVVMNWDSYFQWLMLFAKPMVQANSANITSADALSNAGASLGTVPLPLRINPVISSTAPAKKLIGFVKGETLEELVEAGSQIQESERAMSNQTMTMYRTENIGYRLVYGDTRSILDYNA